jgi:uncharacterized protein (DUF1697 family)
LADGAVTRYLGLLRGVNVGGKNKLPMADLRALFESLGYADVQTFIQSGNVLFSSAAVVKPSVLATAIHEAFGLDVPIVLRTAAALGKVLRANPFVDFDPAALHVGFMATKAEPSLISAIDADAFAPEQFSIRGEEIYLYLPNGMARTKLPAYLDRRLKVPTTVRNWNTVAKLVELATAPTD